MNSRTVYFREYHRRRILTDPDYKNRKAYQGKKYRLEHPQDKSIVAMHKIRFGGLRRLILERDNFMCVDCGMTSIQHKEKWGRELTINHIDGNGRNSLQPNNKPSNLETLCFKCHGRKDSFKYWHERRVKSND